VNLHLVSTNSKPFLVNEGKGIQLGAPQRMTLERAIEYIDIGEYVEATPKSLRLRKRIIDALVREKHFDPIPRRESSNICAFESSDFISCLKEGRASGSPHIRCRRTPASG
jgi:hypothetical protein